MPSKKKKYNARFPAGRIKKIMQTDEEVGKVAQAVPVIISRTLELFVESLLTKSMQITQSRNAKTLTPSHMKQCILSESRFDFLKDLVKNIPDASVQEDNENNANEALDYTVNKSTDELIVQTDKSNEITANFYNEQSTSRAPVIQYGPKVAQLASKLSFSVENLVNVNDAKEVSNTESLAQQVLPTSPTVVSNVQSSTNIIVTPPKESIPSDNIPPLIPITHKVYGHSSGDNLYIDEDYDN